MVSLEWAKENLGRAIPENWFPELLNMSEEKARMFALRFPRGSINLPEPEPVKKASPKKKAARAEEMGRSQAMDGLTMLRLRWSWVGGWFGVMDTL